MDQEIDYSSIILIVLILILVIIVIIIITYKSSSSNKSQNSNIDTDTSSNIDSDLYVVEDKKESRDVFANPSKPDKIDIEKTSNKGVDIILEDMLKNPKFYGVLAADLVLNTVLRATLDKVFRKTLTQGIKNIGIKASLFVGKILSKQGIKLGTKLATKIGTSISTKGAIAASTGPGAPFVAAGLAATEILSIGFDIADMAIPGGTVGYAKMGTNEAYYEIREETIKQLNKALEEANAPSPFIIGPLDKIDGEALTDLMSEQITLIMTSSPPDILLIPMITQIVNDLKAGTISTEDTTNEKVIEKYSALIDQNSLTNEAYRRLCLKYNGKYVINSKGGNSCSFPDKETCHSSYSWPLKQDTDIYAEFKNGTCNVASSNLKIICESNKIPYNIEKSSCDITENYCKTKGADWSFNSKINENDCIVNGTQDFFEMLLGTTITRGLKQIFDPAQYEKCKSDEVDDGYFCRTKKCKEGDETQGADQLCYPKCDNNYKGIGPVCWEKCPDGFVDDGAFCRKPIETITKKSYIAKMENCPQESTANIFGDCIAKRVDREDGVNWAETLWSHADDKPGGKDGCSWNRHVEAAVCFRKCPDGYFGRAYEGCFANGANSDGVTKKFTERALSCNSGYKNLAGICWENCPNGYIDTGAFCSKGGEVITKKTYTRTSGYIPETTVRLKKRTAEYSTRDN